MATGGAGSQWPFARYRHGSMRFRSLFLLGLIGLAGCATPAPPPPFPPAPAVAPAPEAVQPYFTESGIASFYGRAQNGKTTADGDIFNQSAFTAAHRTLAFGTIVRVTNLGNGLTVKVAINDRGPAIAGRIIDLSRAAARALDMERKGITRVRLDVFRADQSGAGS